MLLLFKRILRHLMALTPFEIHRRLPVITLDPLDLLLASYEAREKKSPSFRSVPVMVPIAIPSITM